MNRQSILALALLLLGSAAAQAQDCAALRDRTRVDFRPWKDFFQTTPFGTVGFTLNERLVYFPLPGTSCVRVPRQGLTMRFLFNHRGAREAAVSYVSFALYGFKDSAGQWIRAMQRKGPWQRGKTAMPAPWEPETVYRNGPEDLLGYVAAYQGKDPLSEKDFDQRFGPLHGVPRDSDNDSWNQLVAMAPDAGSADLKKAKYVAHILQRMEVSPGTTTPGKPLSYETEQLGYDALVLRTFSPLEGGKLSTIRIQWAY